MNTKKLRTKMKIYFILLVICAVLTLVGMVYILVNGGEPNAGYVMVPLVIGSIFGSLYQETKKTIDEREKKQKE